MKKKKIVLVSTNRADYDHLYWLYQELKKVKKFDVSFLISDKVDKTKDKIKCNSFKLKIFGDEPNQTLNTIGDAVKLFSKKLAKINPDLVIILGDRYEILSAAISASILKIPIAHLNGGEVTKGAYDEWIRHSVSKMSSLHFVANKKYKDRVIQLGENKNTIYAVGGLSVDNIMKTKLITKLELEKLLKISLYPKTLLVTYHPETLEKKTLNDFRELLKVLKYFKDKLIIFTMPNADTGNLLIHKLIKQFVKKNKNSKYYISLGRLKYLSLAKYSDMVIGNSSSGLLEMPYLSKISINIGLRQGGRMTEETVINSKPKSKDIFRAINKGYSYLDNSRKFKLNYFYGKGNSAKKITMILKNIILGLT
jgi:GDP/UDP-N,N'-diacetylbacillosamine 2-epimerase (hydrolysing)